MPADFINRELSWLEFNQRVLNEALRDDLPLLERLKFLAISDSNLDEFFQVRVGGLNLLRKQSPRLKDLAGLTPAQQLAQIHKRVETFVKTQYRLLNQSLLPALSETGLKILPVAGLQPHQQSDLHHLFEETIAPLLTPFSIDDQGIDLIPSMTLCVAALVQDKDTQEERLVFIPLPSNLPRFIDITGTEDHSCTLLGDLVGQFCHYLFPDEIVTATTPFRLTRNTDIAVQEEDTGDFADEMEEVIIARKHSSAVRLQLQADAPKNLTRVLRRVLNIQPSAVIATPGPIALTDFMQLVFIDGLDHLRSPSMPPVDSPQVDLNESIFDTIAADDVTLLHPYHSYEPVIRLVEEAARDPQTLAIKQVLYRTSKDSRFVKALVRAAQAGKQVTALVELKARFDEERNISVTDELQRAGVHVVYGVKGLKTHAKLTLIVRNEDGKLIRYAHLGTGNYNESTARLYTDVSYFTARPEYTSDASLFFNAVTGRSKLVRCQKLIPAPTQMKRTLLKLIEGETARAKEGEEAYIMAKMNSLQDRDMIEALYRAAEAGVKIDLNVRGICCLKTGKSKAKKNIRVVSIIDQFLEHQRIFYFGRTGDSQVFISSADWMTRNLEKRVEIMTPIEDRRSKRILIDALQACFKDNTQASEIQTDGSSKRVEKQKGERSFRLQQHLYKRAQREAKNSKQERAASFEPHLPT